MANDHEQHQYQHDHVGEAGWQKHEEKEQQQEQQQEQPQAQPLAAKHAPEAAVATSSPFVAQTAGRPITTTANTNDNAESATAAINIDHINTDHIHHINHADEHPHQQALTALATAATTTDMKVATNNTTTTNGSSSSKRAPQLALIPLHPAGKKLQKLEAKPVPIVLGRTNLANWWWKSCDCGHYCRLHCRPVAQNIRSLSKVMVQIDSKGVLYTVGKNPHLVTVTPQRDAVPLQVNDIVSIGRKDREPWMRFQVVDGRGLDLRSPRKKQKLQQAPQESQAPAQPTSEQPSSALAAAATAQLKNSVANTNGKPHEEAQPKPKSRPSHHNNPKAPHPQPPEWITMTKKIPISMMTGGEATATNTNNQQQNETTSNTNDRNTKRRRSNRRADTTSNRLFHLSSENNQTSQQQQQHQQQQVHLLFQDYNTSANLVRLTQRKRKLHNTTNTTNNKRPFIATKQELSLHPNNDVHIIPTTTTTQNEQDLIQDLENWKDIIAEEEASGRKSSFRCHLAKLVVAKNETRDPGVAIWVPPLLMESS